VALELRHCSRGPLRQPRRELCPRALCASRPQLQTNIVPPIHDPQGAAGLQGRLVTTAVRGKWTLGKLARQMAGDEPDDSPNRVPKAGAGESSLRTSTIELRRRWARVAATRGAGL
jgi:hypothetical protein